MNGTVTVGLHPRRIAPIKLKTYNNNNNNIISAAAPSSAADIRPKR